MKRLRRLVILLPLFLLFLTLICLVWRTEKIMQQQHDADLILSIYQNNADRVRLLLAEGASPNARESQIPLPSLWERVLAIVHGQVLKPAEGAPALVIACRDADTKPDTRLKIVHLLLQTGANPMAVDSDGESALTSAIESESVQTVKALLEHGASAVHPIYVSIGNKKNQAVCPICRAVGKKNVAIAKLLLAQGADPNSPGDEGPLLTDAAGDGDVGMVKVLLDYGADAKYYDPNPGTADGNDYSARYAAGHELMLHPDCLQYAEILRLLKQHGAK